MFTAHAQNRLFTSLQQKSDLSIRFGSPYFLYQRNNSCQNTCSLSFGDFFNAHAKK